MIPFAAPTDDILFSLRHVAGADQVADWEGEIAADVIGHFAHLAEGVIAPLNQSGDTQGARLENGRVRMPDGFHEAYAALAEAGWQGLSAPERYGGMELSPLIGAGVWEIFSGANHSMQMVCNLVPGAIDVLMHFGSEEQQAHWVPKLALGEVLSTMCLTEPGAGSDLARIRCTAVAEGGAWKLSGEKIFISGGDQDLSEGILHLVLARSGAQEEGLKGLSLFACAAGAGVKVTRIEEKLGLHASPTCHMVFDGAEAELIGEEGAGLKAMFAIMNHARIDVGLQGIAHAARAAQLSRAYAEERVQGKRADGAPAVIADHADVQRMLHEQESLAIGGRAMSHIACREMCLAARPALVDFLTSLCKIFGSEAGIRAADIGIQVYGGYGYLTEYEISQTWRDARITSIYEGANGIHERTLATRGLRGSGSEEFDQLISSLAGGDSRLDEAQTAWRALRDRVRAADAPEALAHRFAQSSALLFFKACWIKIAAEAAHHPAPDKIKGLADHVLT